MVLLVMACGVLLTVRLRGLQLRKLLLALRFTVRKEEGGAGEVSGFAAMCTALSATIGTGNIVGVATAIAAGGPGALFWMDTAAVFGMAAKYAEGFLAVKYRTSDSTGHILGGPFYYIENGMGERWKLLAKLFSVFGLLAGLMGIGTITQINGITTAVNGFFADETARRITVFGNENTAAGAAAGLIVAVCAALVIIGGIKSVSAAASIVVPFMAAAYVLCTLVIMITHISEIPAAVREIMEGAFGLRPVAGAAAGKALALAVQKGVARGVFSNEACLGSAPIAAAAAKTKEPARQGLIAMTGTFIDTICICTMTGLSIVISGAWKDPSLKGAAVTAAAFRYGLPLPGRVSDLLLTVCLIFFAFTTIIGWGYYSERCLAYLCGGRASHTAVFRVIYIAMLFAAPYLTVEAVWGIADIFNALMALPNIAALIALSGTVASDTAGYFGKKRVRAE